MTIKNFKFSEILRPNIGPIDPGPFNKVVFTYINVPTRCVI